MIEALVISCLAAKMTILCAAELTSYSDGDEVVFIGLLLVLAVIIMKTKSLLILRLLA